MLSSWGVDVSSARLVRNMCIRWLLFSTGTWPVHICTERQEQARKLPWLLLTDSWGLIKSRLRRMQHRVGLAASGSSNGDRAIYGFRCSEAFAGRLGLGSCASCHHGLGLARAWHHAGHVRPAAHAWH